MATFVFAYRASTSYVPGTADTMAAWRAWFAELGGHVVDMGKPVFESGAVGNCASDNTVLGGYSMIDAEDLEAALALAKGCPAVAHGGGVEVGALAELAASE
jgi:hypothetical protein